MNISRLRTSLVLVLVVVLMAGVYAEPLDLLARSPLLRSRIFFKAPRKGSKTHKAATFSSNYAGDDSFKLALPVEWKPDPCKNNLGTEDPNTRSWSVYPRGNEVVVGNPYGWLNPSISISQCTGTRKLTTYSLRYIQTGVSKKITDDNLTSRKIVRFPLADAKEGEYELTVSVDGKSVGQRRFTVKQYDDLRLWIGDDQTKEWTSTIPFDHPMFVKFDNYKRGTSVRISILREIPGRDEFVPVHEGYTQLEEDGAIVDLRGYLVGVKYYLAVCQDEVCTPWSGHRPSTVDAIGVPFMVTCPDAPDPQVTAGSEAQVIAETLMLRHAPGVGSPKKDELQRGDRLNVLSGRWCGKDHKYKNVYWWYVSLATRPDIEGYVADGCDSTDPFYLRKLTPKPTIRDVSNRRCP